MEAGPADAIRDELSDNYGVYLDDRVKEWCIEGEAPSFQNGDTVEGSDDEDDAMFDGTESDFET